MEGHLEVLDGLIASFLWVRKAAAYLESYARFSFSFFKEEMLYRIVYVVANSPKSQ